MTARVGDQISSVEELEALPVGSVILSQPGTVVHKQNEGDYPWVIADDAREYWTNIGLIDCLTWPFLVLYAPGDQPRTRTDREAEADIAYLLAEVDHLRWEAQQHRNALARVKAVIEEHEGVPYGEFTAAMVPGLVHTDQIRAALEGENE